jgi:retinol dehydrogenase 12
VKRLKWQKWFAYPASMGAITPMFAAVHPELAKNDSGTYFVPWARRGVPKAGTQDPALAEKLWNYLDEEMAKFS